MLAVLFLLLITPLHLPASSSCTSPPDDAATVAGRYYGSGKLWKPDDVKDVDITLKRSSAHKVEATIVSVLPAALRQMSGKKTMTGTLTVSPDYKLAGKVKLIIFNFDVTGSVNPAAHTITLHIIGSPMGNHLHFVLTGGLEK